MAISFKKYIDITSGVGAGATVQQRELILRLFTTNADLPTGSFVEMTTLDDVGYYFGTDTEEYRRAALYFGWVSKNITSPQKISFARWADANTYPMIIGGKSTTTVDAWNDITDGAISITLGGTTHIIDSLNFSSAASFADVAAVIETGINAETGTMWTAATVAYDADGQRFILNGGSAGTAAVAAAVAGSGTEILSLVNWAEGANPITNARWSDGATAQTPADCVAESAAANNDFGSFEFLPITGESLVYMTVEQAEAVATWNVAQNVAFVFLLGVFAADAATYNSALIGYGGTALTLVPDALTAGQYPEMVPGIILAATNYNRRNSVQNYMFQQFPTLTPTVTATSDSNAYDALRINYIGRTQTAGQNIDFYQRGYLCGGATDPLDMGVYANEMWLKDAIAASVMTLLLSVAKISANTQGRAQLLAQIQSVIQQALNNGVISVGKTLTVTQRQYIDSLTGIEGSWHNVQSIGYWIDLTINPVVVDSVTEYHTDYVLIYSKNDSIRKVTGSNVLI